MRKLFLLLGAFLVVLILLALVALMWLLPMLLPSQPSGYAELQKNAAVDLQLTAGQRNGVKLDGTPVEVSVGEIASDQANVQVGAASQQDEAIVLLDGTPTNVDLDQNGAPNLELSASISANGIKLRIYRTSDSFNKNSVKPIVCGSGFQKQSSANVVFVMDKSTSMDWSAKLENTQGVPLEVLEKIRAFETNLTSLSEALTESELAEYLSSGECDHLQFGSPKRSACEETEDSLEASRSAIKADNELYARLSKMGISKSTVSDILRIIKRGARISKADVQVGLIGFSGDSYVYQRLTSDTDLVKEQVEAISTSSSTNIGEGLQDGLDEVNIREADRKVVVLLTDGRPTTGLTASEIKTRISTEAKQDNVVMHSIGLGIIPQEVDEPLLQSLASETNGRYFFASNSTLLRQGFEDVLALKQQHC